MSPPSVLINGSANFGNMKTLLREIVKCTVCDKFLPHGPRPVLAASAQARIVIIG